MASFKNTYKREATQGMARLTTMQPLVEKDLTSLPDPVQKYLRYTGAIGKPKIQNVHAVFSGKMKLQENGRWMHFHKAIVSWDNMKPGFYFHVVI